MSAPWTSLTLKGPFHLGAKPVLKLSAAFEIGWFLAKTQSPTRSCPTVGRPYLGA
jgi:hypothetical protein